MRERCRLEVTGLNCSVRFVQGYRFLDACGEALIRLEETLEDGWIPAEHKPTGGVLKNYKLGLTAIFDTVAMAVEQAQFISFEHFLDQTCKVFDILRSTIGIKRILTPALVLTMQAGFAKVEEAEDYIHKMNLCIPSDEMQTLLGGRHDALSFTYCTRTDLIWQDSPVSLRRRLVVHGVRQERQPSFDQRLVQRLCLLPTRQRDAMQALVKLRRSYPETPPVAAQFEFENTFESEFATDTFDPHSFLKDSWKWTQDCQKALRRD